MISVRRSSRDPTYQALGAEAHALLHPVGRDPQPRRARRWPTSTSPPRDAAGVEGAHAHLDERPDAARRRRLPTVAQYRRDVGALVRRYKPQGVTRVGHLERGEPRRRSRRSGAPAAPRSSTSPCAAFCSGCTIVGLDVLDQRSTRQPSIDFRNYIRAFVPRRGPLPGAS